MPRAAIALALGIALVGNAATPFTAAADPIECQRAIVKASRQLVKVRTSILRRCHEDDLKGKSRTCPDAAAATLIAVAEATMTATIAQRCGGDDGLCGSDLTNEDTPTAIGWPSTCPDLAAGACTNAITDCGGIADCLACIDATGVDLSLDLAYTYPPNPPPTTDPALTKCRSQIGKANIKYLLKKAKILGKCWDDRLAGKHSDFCPNAKAQSAIYKIGDTIRSGVCKACGGSDKSCLGADGFTPFVIGPYSTCPGVQGPFTGGFCNDIDPSGDLDSLRSCFECVTDYAASCIDLAQVQGVVSYPEGCRYRMGDFTCGRTMCGETATCPPTKACGTVPGPPPYYDPPSCACLPDGTQPCAESSTYSCNGVCPNGEQCGHLGIDYFSQCGCGNPPCGESAFPTCGGDCPTGESCSPQSIGSVTFCGCGPTGTACGAAPCAMGACPPGEVCNRDVCGCVP